jgi:hypothetical protein
VHPKDALCGWLDVEVDVLVEVSLRQPRLQASECL